MMWRSPGDEPMDAYAFDIEFEHNFEFVDGWTRLQRAIWI